MNDKCHDKNDCDAVCNDNNHAEQTQTVVENYDDYDVRHKLGCKVRVVKSNLSMMEM